MVESAPLLREYTGNGIEGSNPSGSAIIYHGIFRKNNVPYVFLSCGRWEHYHEPTDTPDRLNYNKMAAITEYSIDVCRAASAATFAEGLSSGDSVEFEKQTWKKAFGLMRRPLAKILGISDFNSRANIDRAVAKLMSLGL